MSDTATSSPSRPHLRFGAAAIALLAIGGGAGAFVGHAFQPAIAMAPAHATAIKSLAEGSGIVTIKGRVAERYGNQFVLEDGTGKALVDTGPAGTDASVAPTGAIVSVQGRFDDGAMRPSFLVDPSGKVIALGHGGPGDHARNDHGPRRFDEGERGAPDSAPPSRGPVGPASAPAITPALTSEP